MLSRTIAAEEMKTKELPAASRYFGVHPERVQHVPCGTLVPRCRCGGDTAHGEGGLQTKSGSGTDVPFRAKNTEKADVFKTRVVTVTWEQACEP